MPPKASTSINDSTEFYADALTAFCKAYKNLGVTSEQAAKGIAKLNATLEEYKQQEGFELNLKQFDFPLL
jgi:hypothetical protein